MKRKISSLFILSLCLSSIMTMISCESKTTVKIEDTKDTDPDEGDSNEEGSPQDKSTRKTSNEGDGENEESLLQMNLDQIKEELQKLNYTSLNEEKLKNVEIASTLLTKELGEQLGFVLPEKISDYISNTKNTDTEVNNSQPHYLINISKTKDTTKVLYQCIEDGNDTNKEEVEVEMEPYAKEDIDQILEELKTFNATNKTHSKWMSAYADNMEISSILQKRYLEIKNWETIKEKVDALENAKVLLRKIQGEEQLTYVIIQNLDEEKKIITSVSVVFNEFLNDKLFEIIEELKLIELDGSSKTTDEFKELEQEEVQILPITDETPYDWMTNLGIAAPELPNPEQLKDPAATKNGSIKMYKTKGETKVHWIITYVDSGDEEHRYQLAFDVYTRLTNKPSFEEVQNYDWTNATELTYGEKPSTDLHFDNKNIVSRITLLDDTVLYVFTSVRDNIGIVQSRRYSGRDLEDHRLVWIATNARSRYFTEIRVLINDNEDPQYSSYLDESLGGFAVKELLWMEI